MMERRKRDGESDCEKWGWGSGRTERNSGRRGGKHGENLPNGRHEGERRKGERYGCKERGKQN